MPKRSKGKKHSEPGKGSKQQCKPADKKPSEGSEKKPAAGVSGNAGAQASGSSKTPAPSGKTMNPVDTQAKQTPKTEAAKSTQPTKPKGATAGPAAATKPTAAPSAALAKTTAAPSAVPAAATKPTAAPSTAPVAVTKPTEIKPSAGKSPPKQDTKPTPGKQKPDSKSKEEKKSDDKATAPVQPPKVTPSSAGKVSAVATGFVAAAGATAAVTAVQSTKQKDESKEEKKAVIGDKVSSAASPAKTGADTALDELLDTLGSPADIPESPKFTGPEIQDTVVTSEYVEELGKRDHTIPPNYRKLLDGKGEKMAPPTPPLVAEASMDDDDLVAALSSGFKSSQTCPEVKKPLEEKLEEKPKSAATVATQPDLQKKDVKATAAETSKASIQKKEVKATAAEASKQSTQAIPSDAIDELLGTLEGPPANVPESPVFEGPEVTETIKSTYLEELGKRDHTIPPEYRNLLDGKDHEKAVQPSAPVEPEPTMTDADLVDEFSKDFELSCSPTVQTTPAVKPKGTPQDNKAKPEVVVASSTSTVKAAAAPSAGMDSALDDLLGTLEGPDLTVPESPVYSGPEVTETSTAVYREELGKRDDSIPPAYRHLLDGKEDGKVAPPPPPEEEPLTDDQLLDEFSMDFSCSKSPAKEQAQPVEPKVSSKEKKAEAEVVAASSAAVKAAPAPYKAPAQAPSADPLDALAGTLGVRKEDPSDKKPAVDKVKEGTPGKEKKEKLGEDERTIHPDRRLKEVKDKDGKPLLPKPEESPKPMNEAELLDALTEGFVTSPATPVAPLQSSPKKGSGSDVVSCSKASTVKSGAPQPTTSDIQIPDDALDLLSGSLGQREVDPDENKPVVDVVKEKAKAEHIDRLGDRDDTIPPEYRNLLDGKDKGQGAKPTVKEEDKPKKSLSGDAAIDALSSGFASCDTKSTEKTKQPSTDKNEKPSASAPVSQTSGKQPDAAKQASSAKPSVPKAGKS
ncbi:calpastatin isoform X4 [Xenopus laevis]|uniref:Calpastatin n=1 Tax=Xenopus laevis TaxID=8355 RepID=A0A8J0UAM7_XENLA|nr:calpastatin isoform X4 [Xenopus laevis]